MFTRQATAIDVATAATLSPMANHSEKCSAAELEQISEARTRFGLTSGTLGATEIASDSTLVVVGFFTSLVSQRVTSLAPDNRKLHVAILSVCMMMFSFMIIHLFVQHTAATLWRLSRDFATTVFRFLKFVCSILLILTSHFLTDILFANLNGNLSWIEAGVVVIAGIFTVYFVLQLFHLSESAAE